MKWTKNDRTNTYLMNDYRIIKTSSGKITKAYGYDLFIKIHKIRHFNTLAEAKAYAESL